MITSEQRRHLLPPELLLSPLPETLVHSKRRQARDIPTEELRSQGLLWLLHHPLQRSDDLQLALGMSASSLHRFLRDAEAQGEIEYIQQTSRWYYLSNQGLLAAAAQEHAEVKGLARVWDADERGLLKLLARVPQLTMMQELVNGLARHAPRILAYADGTLADIEWSWRRDPAHRFLTHAREASYQADAALCFYRYPPPMERQSREQGVFYTLFLLFERFTDDDRAIRDRLVSLMQYRESRRTFYATFPLVLIITETVRQRDRWHRQAQEAAQTLHLQAPLVSAITHLVTPRDGTITTSWPLPWQQLGEKRPCQIQELLIPMPLEALPPDILIPRVEMGQPRIQKRQVLIGNFQQRAEALDMAQETTEEVLALLGGVVLRPRYIELLHLLYRAPLLSASEMVDVLEGTDLTLPTQIRYLQHLQRWNCIHRHDSTCGMRWRLTRRGVQVLALIDQTDARTLIDPEEDQQRGIAQQILFLEHTAGVYRCVATFGRAARQTAHHRLLWWETGAPCEHHYLFQGHWSHFRPDALFAYATETASHLAWLEYDRHTESREALVTKFQTYQTFLSSQQWRKLLLPRLPMLLLVVPDPARRQAMREIVQEMLGLGTMRVRITTMPQLEHAGPGAAIWEQLVPMSGVGRRVAAFEG